MVRNQALGRVKNENFSSVQNILPTNSHVREIRISFIRSFWTLFKTITANFAPAATAFQNNNKSLYE